MATAKPIILVTGANKGIGLAAVRGLHAGGAIVILTARNAERGRAAYDDLPDSDRLHFHQLDVDDDASVRACAQYVMDTFGRLDVLVNNAGINYDTWHDVLTADLLEVEQTLRTNTLGPWRVTQAMLPALRISKDARIISLTSGAGELDAQNGNTPGYSLSKFALNGWNLALARKLQSEGITANVVGPGWVRTDMGGSGASRSPEQGADTIVYLALDDSVKGRTGKFFRDRREVDWLNV